MEFEIVKLSVGPSGRKSMPTAINWSSSGPCPLSIARLLINLASLAQGAARKDLLIVSFKLGSRRCGSWVSVAKTLELLVTGSLGLVSFDR
jgi:hypothetical protein